MGGLGLIDLRTDADIAALKLLRNSVFSMSETGKMIMINLYHSQRESGLGHPLLERPDISVSYLTPTWLTSIRQFAYQHNLRISTTAPYVPTLKYVNDKFLMETPHLDRFTTSEIVDINLVRLHLQASTLSDLAAGTDGRTICPHCYKGDRPPSFQSQPHWPRQPPPTKAQSKIWSSFLSIVYLRYDIFWDIPLGLRLSTPPLQLDPLATSLHPFEYTTLSSFLAAIPPFFRRLLHHHVQIASDKILWRAFRSKSRLEIVTDGSLATNIGTFGWRLLRPPDTILFEGTGPVDGPIELATSTRSELGGFAAPLLLVAAISRFWGLPHRCKFRWVVDSQAAISKVEMVTRPGARARRQPNNIDFLSTIAELYKVIRRPLSITWIKGHQDSAEKTGPLSRDALNNIAVDALATKHRTEKRLPPPENSSHIYLPCKSPSQSTACVFLAISTI